MIAFLFLNHLLCLFEHWLCMLPWGNLSLIWNRKRHWCLPCPDHKVALTMEHHIYRRRCSRLKYSAWRSISSSPWTWRSITKKLISLCCCCGLIAQTMGKLLIVTRYAGHILTSKEVWRELMMLDDRNSWWLLILSLWKRLSGIPSFRERLLYSALFKILIKASTWTAET